jgi:hypothetical protein
LTPHELLLQSTNGAPRVLVADRSGRAFFVETHPALKEGATRDAWMSGRVVGHFAIGGHVPGFSGVLIFTPRRLKPVHATTPTQRHALGACADCTEVTR